MLGRTEPLALPGALSRPACTLLQREFEPEPRAAP